MSQQNEHPMSELYRREGDEQYGERPPAGGIAPTLGLADRFIYHPPTSPYKGWAHESARAAVWACAERLDRLVPPGREKSLTLTHLETALFWANAAIARAHAADPDDQGDTEGPVGPW